MNSIIEQIYNFINSVEQYIQLLILNQNAMADRYVSIIMDDLSLVFPKIVSLYDDEKYGFPKEDKEYWVNQMQRIIDTLEGDDSFAKIDVLYNETCENMMFIATRIGE